MSALRSGGAVLIDYAKAIPEGMRGLCPWPKHLRKVNLPTSCLLRGANAGNAGRPTEELARVAARFRPRSRWLKENDAHCAAARPATVPGSCATN